MVANSQRCSEGGDQEKRCPEGWQAEFWLPSRPSAYTPFTVPTKVDDIAATDTCVLCAWDVDRTNVRYDVPYHEGEKLLVARCDEVPGYRCADCEIEWYDPKANLEALEAARRVVRAAGDRETEQRLSASIEAGLHAV